MSMPFMQRLATFEKRRVHHPQFEYMKQAYLYKMEEAHILRKPAPMLIAGPAGAGKTSPAEYVADMFPTTFEETDRGRQRIVPAFYCKTPEKASLDTFCKALLTNLGVEVAGKPDAYELKQIFIDAVRSCKTQIIFIDEIQHLLKIQGQQRMEVIRNWIKTILDECGVPIVMIGMPSCVDFINTDEQLETRVSQIIRVSPFALPVSGDSDFEAFLLELANRLSTDCAITLCAGENPLEFAQRFWLATGGNMRSTSQLIIETAPKVHRENQSDISLKHLANHYALSPKSTNKAGNRNPFSASRTEISTMIKEVEKAVARAEKAAAKRAEKRSTEIEDE